MGDRDALLDMAGHLALLSLLAVGGVNTVVPELHRLAVDRYGWMSGSAFTDLFALAQAAPGPNVLFVALIGWKAAGMLGAFVAMSAISGPAFLLAYGMARVTEVWGSLNWFKILQDGLAPITVGLIAASAWLLTDAAAQSWRSYVVTGATAAIVLTTRIHPLWLFAAAAAAGLLGLV